MINSFLKSLLAILVISSCAHEKTTSSEAIPETRPRDELSLKSDRSALDEERKQIPIETKRSNDEMALVLQLMQTNELGEMQEPSKIRDRFDKAVRERRTKLDRELQKKRDEFSHNEKTTRDLVFAEFKKAREDFAKEKHESGERSQFFSNQDEKRREFTSDQQEKRSGFEAEIREKRKDFEDYIRERQNSFNEEYRSYSKRYDEARKANSLKKNMQEKERKIKDEKAKEELFRHSTSGGVKSAEPATNPSEQKDLEDFQSFPKSPGQPLEQNQ